MDPLGLDVRRLLIFREVAVAGSLGAAARQLGLTQPAVSQQVRALEREVGCALLVRTSKGVAPTAAGELALARAHRIAEELATLEHELAEAVAAASTVVRIAAYPSASATVIPQVMAGLQGPHPHLRTELLEAEPPEAEAALLADQVDLALAFRYPHEDALSRGLTWVPLFEEGMDLVIARDHPLAQATDGAAAPTVGALELETWVAGCDRCRRHVTEICSSAGYVPRIRHATDDYVLVQNMVAAGLGVAVLPQSALTAFRHPDVVVVPGDSFGRRECGLVLRDGPVPEATQAVIGAFGPFRRRGRTPSPGSDSAHVGP
ncbi:LysR family transcriptional regulator [Alloalcanivorax gelatiniphagus]